jgi:hypothetical protein
MAKKKKRKRPSGYRTADTVDSSGSTTARSAPTRFSSSRRSAPAKRRIETRQVGSSEPSRSQSPWGSMFGRRASAGRRGPSLQPPVGKSLARGMSVVGRSPLLLVITFLAALGLWLGFSGYGVIQSATPQAMVLLESLPPLHTLLDLNFLAGGRTVSAVQVVTSSAGLVMVRAALMCVWVSLIRDSVQGAPEPVDLRSTLRRAARSFVPMVGLEIGFLVLATASIFLVSSFLGSLGVILMLVVGLYFFSYAPVIAVVEEERTLRAAQLSIRAARVPGPQHLLFTTAYLALTLFLSVVVPGSRVAAATPSVAVWVYTLLVGFLHVSVLAAFTYRWFLIRDHALATSQ